VRNEEEAINATVAYEVLHPQFSPILHVTVTLQRSKSHIIIHGIWFLSIEHETQM